MIYCPKCSRYYGTDMDACDPCLEETRADYYREQQRKSDRRLNSFFYFLAGILVGILVFGS